MTRRTEISGRLSLVLGLPEIEAAAAIGVSVTTFRDLVEKNQMPKPRQIRSRRIYDVDEIRASFKALPHEGEVEHEAEAAKWGDVVA